MSRWMRTGALTLAILAAAGVVVLAIFNPVLALQGWLTAMVWSAMIPVGALTLLMIHRLTGGEWGFALAPVLETAARAIAGVALIAVPVLIFPRAIYRWHSFPELPVQVGQYYMTAPFFALRSVLAFCIWSVLAWVPALRRTATGAACGLIVLAIVSNFIAIDWVESSRPGYHSSNFGFGLWIEQMLSAFALCALIGTEGDETRRCRDLAGLLIAVLLGVMYFLYVEFAIIWYGDLPDKIAWFITRSRTPWPEIGGFALLIGAAAPFLAMLNQQIRESETALSIIGGGMTLAIILHIAWLLAPSFGVAALLPAGLAIIAIAIAFATWLRRFTGHWPVPWHPTLPVTESHG